MRGPLGAGLGGLLLNWSSFSQSDKEKKRLVMQEYEEQASMLHSFHSEMFTLLDDPFGPAGLLGGRGRRRRGRALVMAVWTIRCPIHR